MAVKTIEEAEGVLAEYATADAKLQGITAKMDEQITAIRNKYDEDLRRLQEEKEEKFNSLQMFAETNPEMFNKKKSLPFTHGTIGFRTGTPKLKLLKKFTWGAVTELLKDRLPDYVRIEETPAKDKLLADREEEHVKKHFSKVGIEVTQDESFYVELKKEGEE